MIFNIFYCNNQIIAMLKLCRHVVKNIPTLHVILLSEHTELLLIINILIIFNNSKDYISLGIGMCIFFLKYI